ncbi:hypothetical protein I6B53_02510 [Schaalia sp. 19OD2882]|uniref:hypothetical protein n=1 Tax=Schaalia sp. 19OD2882 TaxID=2794089 RepID=UPI001C1F1CA9|nr:hypothetical protein [Schaalia sp. 19OD2882]QWW20004.1 hypothetical protein I6B53_02510 [Schaalia sp. 19OD2882]
MCRAVTCKVCGKTTWAGCGRHVDAVKAGVPSGQWCGGTHSREEIAKARAGRPTAARSWIKGLFGRG